MKKCLLILLFTGFFMTACKSEKSVNLDTYLHEVYGFCLRQENGQYYYDSTGYTVEDGTLVFNVHKTVNLLEACAARNYYPGTDITLTPIVSQLPYGETPVVFKLLNNSDAGIRVEEDIYALDVYADGHWYPLNAYQTSGSASLNQTAPGAYKLLCLDTLASVIPDVSVARDAVPGSLTEDDIVRTEREVQYRPGRYRYSIGIFVQERASQRIPRQFYYLSAEFTIED